MFAHTYVATAQKPTIVSHCATGNFTGPDELNLIIGRSSRIEVLLMTPDGLQSLYDIPLYGRIAVMKLFRPSNCKQDLLFLVTEKARFCVLSFNTATKKIESRSVGDLKKKVGRKTDVGPVGIIDPLCRVIGTHLYDGIFQLLLVEPSGCVSKEAFDVRLEDLQVIQLCFLHGYERPTLLVLSEDAKKVRHLRSYTLNLTSKELDGGPWPTQVVSASYLIPLPPPFHGVLTVGSERISYHSSPSVTVVSKAFPRATEITAWGMIDNSRYMLGDLAGNLYVVMLKHNDEYTVQELHINRVGTTSIANTLCYLDSGCCFVGSVYGDSQLITLNEEKDSDGSFIEVVQEYPNIGAIQDFCLVDTEKQSRASDKQMVACSGAYKEGSLRIIRNGIGLNEEASIDLPGIKGVWSLLPSSDATYHKFLVEAFVTETRVLAIDGESLEEVEIPGFQGNTQTLHCANVAGDAIVQITTNEVRLVSCSTLQLLDKWAHADGSRITVGQTSELHVIVSVGGGKTVLLAIEGGKLTEAGSTTMEFEVSCFSIIMGGDLHCKLVAVGLWTQPSVRLLRLPSLQEEDKQEIGGSIIPRSLIFAQLGQTVHVLCGMGDGYMLNWRFDAATTSLTNKKTVALGTQPVNLTQFSDTKGNACVFASSDRPAVMQASNRKLVLSNVNIKDVFSVTPFHSEAFPDCLAFALEGTMQIGALDEIQKLHISKIPLGQQPRRITLHSSSNSLCVLTIRYLDDEELQSAKSDVREVNYIKLLDAFDFTETCSYQLGANEFGASVLGGVRFKDDDEEYLVVGTTFVDESEEMPKIGRLLVFTIEDGQLRLVSETATKGVVYTLACMDGLLLAGVNTSVVLYEWIADEEEDTKSRLTERYLYRGNTCVQFIKVQGRYVLVADMMRSISVLAHEPAENSLEEVARDYGSNYMTACEILEPDVYLGAEMSSNLFVCKRNVEAKDEDDRARLLVTGRFHVGEFVNCISRGALVINPMVDNEPRISPSHLFGTVNGVIGVVAPLNREQYIWLQSLEDAILKLTQGLGVGGLRHSDWRAFENELHTYKRKGIIDGDLVEHYLELSEEDMAKVAKQMKMDVTSLYERVEDLSRIH